MRKLKSNKKTLPQASLTGIPENCEDRQKRRRKRKMPRYLKIIFAALGAYLLFSFLLGGYKIWEIKQEIIQHNVQKEVLLKQQKDLEKELAFLQEPEMIEKLARESLGMVKADEILIVPAVPGINIPKPKNINIEEIRD
ncbi:MAG: septum formation initiator family protein [Clostridia bacterium]|nr:septum formation initiator family protein [Clostridia bacterium]MDD4146587.1 septum formation initiator family protein [Clostridia bacterium]MDD4666280.1 septum formation initiator family protein [Clostridia bacterium]